VIGAFEDEPRPRLGEHQTVAPLVERARLASAGGLGPALRREPRCWLNVFGERGKQGCLEHPHTTTSASPWRKSRIPSAMDCAPAAQAVPIEDEYPRRLCLIATRAVPMLGSIPGSR
jgi:hypothetical protein